MPEDNPSLDVTAAPSAVTAAETRVAFTTGELVGGRYRIVGLLGRGGMGEVYRADDLALGQPVALKFLPRSVESHPEQLERLRAEVRITRQVSHPNVCRVYDLGAVGSRHFLTMEFIDGEDLASLLRRIGRLPADKALETARQLCAGLAAAHDRGVIHRDLKPANVMLDGRGRARVTDFGLAVAGAGARADRSGTPAYMAPEQLSGGALSARTDIYALGLVLFELFTGRRLFAADSVDQLKRDQSDGDRLHRSAADVNLDPAVERVILRCVEFDPAKRPESALAVAAALPGADPLAAALAAGETPSPALVAAASDDRLLSRAQTIALVVLVAVGCAAAAFVTARQSVFAILAPPYSAEVLAVKAGELLQRTRPGDVPARTARNFDIDGEFGIYMLQHRELAWTWSDIARVKPAPIHFWYRASPGDLLPREFPGGGRVTPADPPEDVPGMTLLRTDLSGRLIYLDAKPTADDAQRPAAAEQPWALLFREAGLDMSRFTAVPPEWIPLSWGDARAAWTGAADEYPAIPLRIEAASYRGRPTFFVVAGPWTAQPGSAPLRPASVQVTIAIVALITVALPLVAAILMARASLRSGRADRRGAARLAAAVAALQLGGTWLVMAHSPGSGEVRLLLQALVPPLVLGALAWMLYIGLEPFVRRTWPSSLISWNRIVEGRFRDARVARDILIGLGATAVLDGLDPLLAKVTLVPPRGLNELLWIAASSLHDSLGAAILTTIEMMLVSLVVLIMLCLVRMVIRRDAIVTVAFAAVVGLMISASYAAAFRAPLGAVFVVVYGALYGAAWALLLVRFGLIAFLAHEVSDALLSGVVTLDPGVWYAGSSLLNLTLIAALTAYAAWVCLAARAPRTLQ